jgi:hypothetical protein
MESCLTTSDNAEVGVLVLGGSSGRVEAGRCALLSAHGMTAMSIRWFGGPGQPPGICEVPLETFVSALDQLAATGVSRCASDHNPACHSRPYSIRLKREGGRKDGS